MGAPMDSRSSIVPRSRSYIAATMAILPWSARLASDWLSFFVPPGQGKSFDVQWTGIKKLIAKQQRKYRIDFDGSTYHCMRVEGSLAP